MTSKRDRDITYSNDPKMVAARVFLGRLPQNEPVTKQEVEEIFAKYGKILGISLFPGFGFVQFEEEKDALKAIQAESQAVLKGSKLAVHSAGERRKRPASPSSEVPPAKVDPTGKSGVDAGMDRPFDCVIVVSQKRLRPYAEQIERRLLELNLTIDLIFLLQETSLETALADMFKRGVLYIIVVQPQSEEQRTVTLYNLQGTPREEHRNMPLDDALLFLAKHFNAYLSGLRIGSEQPSMGFLLNLLSDGKHLSVNELDRIILHLQDRRDHLIESQGGKPQPRMPPGFPPALPPNQLPQFAQPSPQKITPNASELQQKIMNILNGGRENQQSSALASSSTQHLSTAKPTTSAGGSALDSLNGFNLGSLGNLNLEKFKNLDPNLKKAIDSLTSNPTFIRNISSSGNTSATSTLTTGSGMTTGMSQMPANSYGLRPTGLPPSTQQYGMPTGHQPMVHMNMPPGQNIPVMGGSIRPLGPGGIVPRPQSQQFGPYGGQNFQGSRGPPPRGW